MILTYANQLTILRMIFIPCFVLLIIYGHPKTAAMVFILAGLTDGLDGLLARKLQQKTVLGSYLDPMADKLLLTAAFVTLSVRTLPLAVHIPVWLTVLAISRDVLIALSALIIHLQTGHTEFPPSMLGKCTTVSQLATVGCGLLANFSEAIGNHLFMPSVYASLILTLASGLHYFYRSAKIIGKYQRVENVHGQDRHQDTRG